MLGTSQRQSRSDRSSAYALIPALACAGVLFLALENAAFLAFLAAAAFLVAAKILAAERPLLLLAALVLVHGGWSMQARLDARISTPTVIDGRHLNVVSLRPARGLQPARLRVQDLNDKREYLLSAWDAPWLPTKGECITGHVRLRPPLGSHNFYGFDYARWLFAQGIAGTGSIRALQPCAGARPSQSVPPARMDDLSQGAGRALLKALLLADRSEFTPAIWNTLARTGTSHLFAISGLHVSLIAAMAGGLGYLAWMSVAGLQQRMPRKRLVVLASIGGVLGYMLVAAGQVSAQRAGFSALLVLGLLLSGRRIEPLRVWAWALLIVLLWNPFAVLGAAWGLSFAASLLLLFLLPRLRGRGAFISLVVIQLALGLGMAPLVAAYFGQWSTAGLALNLILVPALAVTLPLCLLAFAVAGLWPEPLQWMSGLLGQTFSVLEQVSGWPWSVLPAGNVSFIGALAAFATFIALVRSKTRLTAALWACSSLLAAIAALQSPAAPAWGTARFSMLDVGQGQAIVIQTRSHWLVVDAGPHSPRGSFDAGAMVVAPHLRARGAKIVDVLVLTHGDNDHAGGGEAIAQEFPVMQRWGFQGSPCESGLRWVGDGVVLRSLPLGAQKEWSDNDRSCVIELVVGDSKMLLTADIEARAEMGFLNEGGGGSYDAVSVPHHGSKSSSTSEFVARVQPQLALVSAGRFNRWNFPSAIVSQRWETAGAVLLNTAVGGAIDVELPSMRVTRPPSRPWHLQ